MSKRCLGALLLWVASLLLALGGCNGFITDAAGEDRDWGSYPPGTHDRAERSGPPPRDLLRLTRYEYENTLARVLPARILANIGDALAQVPPDAGGHELDRLSNQVTLPHVRGYAAVAAQLARQVRTSADARASLLPCLESVAAEGCVREFVNIYAPRIIRRPITDADMESMMELYMVGAARSPANGAALVVEALFQHPEFLFHVEVGEETSPGLIALAPHELRERLSYYLTGHPADERLVDASVGGLTSDDLLEQSERLLDTAEARRHFRHFVAQWLELNHLAELGNVPEAVSDGASFDGLAEAGRDELLDLLEHLLFEEGATFTDVMTTDLSMVTDPALAEIYGVAPGTEAQPLVRLTDGRHDGILTRVGLVANDNGIDNPIKRGAFIRRAFLCEQLSPPADVDLDAAAAIGAAEDTTRQRWENRTSGAVCQGCHVLINPTGFAMSDFDGLGRYRTEERVLDPSTFEFVTTAPVDAEADVILDSSLGAERVVGGVELGALIGTHPVAQRCFARRWYEFATGRRPSDADEAALRALTERVATESLRDIVISFALDADFRHRAIALADDTEGGE